MFFNSKHHIRPDARIRSAPAIIPSADGAGDPLPTHLCAPFLSSLYKGRRSHRKKSSTRNSRSYAQILPSAPVQSLALPNRNPAVISISQISSSYAQYLELRRCIRFRNQPSLCTKTSFSVATAPSLDRQSKISPPMHKISSPPL
jgi:hypothetical protein